MMQEVTISIPDDAYANLKIRAQQEGFGTPEIYMADVIVNHAAIDPVNYDHLFTPDVISELDQICAEIDAGAKMYTLDEVAEHLAENRKAWLAKHQR
jgi:hypothetical protein